MAPLNENDVSSMLSSLKGAVLLKGHRGSQPVSISALIRLVMDFSALVMGISDHIESIDLNPVKCTRDKCVVADARILLSKTQKQ
jgi:hypothetical protein